MEVIFHLPKGRKIETQQGNPVMSKLSFMKGGMEVSNFKQSEQERLKRMRKSKSKHSTMNLAWLSLWWRRMERESEKETLMKTERKSGDYLRRLLVINNKSSDTSRESSVGVEGGSDVLIVRHPLTDETKEHHPAVSSSSGQGLLSRGDKRFLHGGTASPAKRKKTFSKLLSYWENKTDSDNLNKTNYGLNKQSEILLLGPGSEGVRGSLNTGGGDDLK